MDKMKIPSKKTVLSKEFPIAKGKTREMTIGTYKGKGIMLNITGNRLVGIVAPESAAVYNQMMAHQTIKYTEGEDYANPGMHHIIPFHSVQMATFENLNEVVTPKTDAFCGEDNNGLKVKVIEPAYIVMEEVGSECSMSAQDVSVSAIYEGQEITAEDGLEILLNFRVGDDVESFDPETKLAQCYAFAPGDSISLIITASYNGEETTSTVTATIVDELPTPPSPID